MDSVDCLNWISKINQIKEDIFHLFLDLIKKNFHNFVIGSIKNNNNEIKKTTIPNWFWAVAVFSLLWNLMGVAPFSTNYYD
jgi:hypothetical protein